MSNKFKKILVLPNEDGFGPSSLISYVVKEIHKTSKHNLSFTICNQSRYNYNKYLYTNLLKEKKVSLNPIWNIIQLMKDENGEVSIPDTLKAIGNYKKNSDQYLANISPTSFNLVLDFGVPAAAKWAVSNDIKSLSVFDHAWGKTLQMIYDNQFSCDKEKYNILRNHHNEWYKLISEIKSDESFTKYLYAFPPFIMPNIFRNYWKKISGVTVKDIGSVLGGNKPHKSPNIYNTLGLTKPGDAILIQGGDTAVWDKILKKIVPAFVNAEKKGELEKKKLNIVIYIPERLVSNKNIKVIEEKKLERVRRLSFIPGGTIQEILPAFSFLVTRAGGGSVNDAIACRIPFICVREPKQLQVEEILKMCLEQKLTRSIEPKEFEDKPIQIIMDHYKMSKENQNIIEIMREIPCHGEQIISQFVLDLLNSG